MGIFKENWREITDQAEQAKQQMLANREKGEAMFADLVLQYPSDGMVYFKRAEAYEALSQYDLALEDYRRAMALFPMQRWKRIAKEGFYRVHNQIM